MISHFVNFGSFHGSPGCKLQIKITPDNIPDNNPKKLQFTNIHHLFRSD